MVCRWAAWLGRASGAAPWMRTTGSRSRPPARAAAQTTPTTPSPSIACCRGPSSRTGPSRLWKCRAQMRQHPPSAAPAAATAAVPGSCTGRKRCSRVPRSRATCRMSASTKAMRTCKTRPLQVLHSRAPDDIRLMLMHPIAGALACRVHQESTSWPLEL